MLEVVAGRDGGVRVGGRLVGVAVLVHLVDLVLVGPDDEPIDEQDAIAAKIAAEMLPDARLPVEIAALGALLRARAQPKVLHRGLVVVLTAGCARQNREATVVIPRPRRPRRRRRATAARTPFGPDRVTTAPPTPRTNEWTTGRSSGSPFVAGH